jgi:hypothetical protein
MIIKINKISICIRLKKLIAMLLLLTFISNANLAYGLAPNLKLSSPQGMQAVQAAMDTALNSSIQVYIAKELQDKNEIKIREEEVLGKKMSIIGIKNLFF